MAEETQYTAKTGMVQISTANTSLDGAGTFGTVITAGANGTHIKNIFVKAVGSTTAGMIRLFTQNAAATVTRILAEIEVPAITQAAIRPTFETVLPIDFDLQSGMRIVASTQNAETFNVIAEGLDWAYYSSGVRQDTTKYNPKFSSAGVATANSNLNGTGTVTNFYSAGSSGTYKGNSVSTINIKATVANTPGMVRIFIYDGTTRYLFKEVIIPAEAISGTDQSFNYTIDFDGNDLDLQAGYSLMASTQVAQNFNLMGEGNDWSYYA